MSQESFKNSYSTETERSGLKPVLHLDQTKQQPAPAVPQRGVQRTRTAYNRLFRAKPNWSPARIRQNLAVYTSRALEHLSCGARRAWQQRRAWQISRLLVFINTPTLHESKSTKDSAPTICFHAPSRFSCRLCSSFLALALRVALSLSLMSCLISEVEGSLLVLLALNGAFSDDLG